MSQSLADIILHIVFSTKDRNPWIHSDIEDELFRYMSGTAKQLNSSVIAINGVSDHVHMLLHLGKSNSISDLVSVIKSSSSRWIKTKGDDYRAFCWQSGYGAFSVSRSILKGAINYIANQKEHHKTISFKHEYLEMLQRLGVKYDEKYLWD